MVLEGLSQSLRDIVRKIKAASYIDKEVIREVVRDIQRALITADVNVHLALSLSREVERRALTEKPLPGLSQREHVIKIIYDELVKILGTPKKDEIKKKKILMVGLYGQGKTTTCGKLAKYYRKRGMKVGLIAADTHRPAAIDQLCQIGEQVNVPVYADRNDLRPSKIVREGLEHFKDHDIIIVDSAGRHALDSELIEEIKRIATVLQPDEIFLIIDATIGQSAGPQARGFHDALQLSGVIVTKLDGTAKGGGALSAVAATGAPIIYIGTGEHLDDLEPFEPTRFISRLLGMGDLKTLLEKAEETITEEQAQETVKKIMSGKFTLKDMYVQMDALTRMGPLKKLFSLIPGFGIKMSDAELEATQRKLRIYKVIMNSMTPEELENPKILKSSRITRIARGSGTDTRFVRELLHQYNQARKAVKGFTSNRKLRRQLMRQLQAGGIDIGDFEL